jgi:hypothetical protein
LLNHKRTFSNNFFLFNFFYLNTLNTYFTLLQRVSLFLSPLPTRWRLRKFIFKRKKFFKNTNYLQLSSLWKNSNYNSFSTLLLHGKLGNSRRKWARLNNSRRTDSNRIRLKLRVSKKVINAFFLKRYAELHFHVPKKVKPTFLLRQRYFLTSKNLNKNIWKFLYAKSKYTFNNDKKNLNLQLTYLLKPSQKKSLFFVNLYKKLLWKMRKSRYAHWSYRTTGKLNEWRYNKLLSYELGHLVKDFSKQMLVHILFRTLYKTLSWRQVLLLLSFNLVVVNGKFCKQHTSLKKGDIIELPTFIKPDTLRNRLPKSNVFKKIISRGKKSAYKAFRSKNIFNKPNIKKIPKIFKKLPMGYKFLGSTLARDSSINALALIYDLMSLSHDLEYKMTYSSVLTLQNWRYRFD